MWLKTNPPFSTNRQQSLINSDKLESISVRAPGRDCGAWTVRGDLSGSQGSCILHHGSEQECNDFILGLVDDLDIAAAIPAELLRIAQVLARIATSADKLVGSFEGQLALQAGVYTMGIDESEGLPDGYILRGDSRLSMDETDIPEASWQDDMLKAIGD